jgi:predicted kinase
MRKWMRERLQRRKKTQEQKPPAESAPPPLQPVYYESAEPAASERQSQPEPEVQPATEQVAEPEAPEAAEHTGQNRPSEGRPKRRRRRGRGGRGRGAAAARPQAPLQPTLVPPSEARETPPAEPAVQAAPATTPVSSRAPKGVVVLAIGLPGSGKSSWFKRHGIAPLSSDLLRQLLFDDAEEQRFQDLVFSNLRSMLKARLIARRPMNYVDATNLSQHDRHTWIKMARDYGYEVHAVFFDVPLEVCLERNQKRKRTVAEDAMRRMAAKLRPPTFEEGFAKITVVRVKKKETA